MDERTSAIYTQFLVDLKLADAKYTQACNTANLPVEEAVKNGVDALIKVAIANSFALEATQVVKGKLSDGMVSKEDFLAQCEEVYDRTLPSARRFADLIQTQIAEKEAEDAVKN